MKPDRKIDGKADRSTPENPAFTFVDSDGKPVTSEKIMINGVTYYEMWFARKPESLAGGGLK